MPRISLQRALLAGVAAALLAGALPAAVLLDHLLAAQLEARAREDLALAPRILADRNRALEEAMRMHAKDLAGAPALAEAVARGASGKALAVLEGAPISPGEEPILVDSQGRVLVGPPLDHELISATQRNEMPVAVSGEAGKLFAVALAPVRHEGEWVGAAGVASALDRSVAETLAGLTRSEVLLFDATGDLAATTAPRIVVAKLARLPLHRSGHGRVREVEVPGGRCLVVSAPLAGVATVLFARDLDRELAILPKLRAMVLLSGAGAMAVALALGAFLAARLARPVRSLAAAADRVAAGDFEAPLAPSTIREVDRVAQAFADMRRALAARLRDLEEANRELAQREARLRVLQSELIQRDRLAASGRLVAELAHEIRNPIASLRNCLEIVRRRLDGDPRGHEFASLAIDELLRLHRLAEQMLDLNRPRDPRISRCDAGEVAREVAALVRAGALNGELSINVDGSAWAAIPPDALRQVLLNLAQNAREAVPAGLELDVTVRREGEIVFLEVTDNGPGIPPDILPRVFDPFFTTKGSVHGTGLGLFVAEGIVRRYGGRIEASNRTDGTGACFRIELVAAEQGKAAPGKAERGGPATAGHEGDPRRHPEAAS